MHNNAVLQQPLFVGKPRGRDQAVLKGANKGSKEARFLTCERPGEGAGWGLEGDPVIGCGALFISWSSAWGGRCGPVYKSDKREQGD